ncbi:unnamed protein product [Protopolystoma xenopodis]|uniref:Uncharacterized protein n=1 Tax=Protopolystoma xenopodis TaxID=117903 RepID=A0A3S5C275_9PLAT|nr:unnamed protein product [Protopolystoma xenopodis]
MPFLKGCGRHVEKIDRRHSNLLIIPDEVLRNCRTLEECRLDANQIKDFPKNFFRMERIRYLTLSDNELSRIPPGIGNFSNLIELDISRNGIHFTFVTYQLAFAFAQIYKRLTPVIIPYEACQMAFASFKIFACSA